MPRPSSNCDARLLEAGGEILREKGLPGLSVRQVCQRAGVNLGMFTYHFQTKENFLRQLLEKTCDAFFRGLLDFHHDNDEPLDRLISALDNAIVRIDAESCLAATLFQECVKGTPCVLELAEAHLPRHLKLLVELIRDCQASGKLRNDIPAEQVLCALVNVILLPMVQPAGIFRRIDPKGDFLGSSGSASAAPAAAARERMDLVFNGLRPRNESSGPLPAIRRIASRIRRFSEDGEGQ